MPRWKKIVFALLAVTAVVTITTCAWWTWRYVNRPEYCAPGVIRSKGECVGVNGSGYAFGTKEIDDVAKAIKDENARIEREEHPYVTVAMMLPLQAEDEKGLRAEMRRDLIGAYLGQFQLNKLNSLPKVKMVLANPGRDYAQQQSVVDDLLDMRDSKDHLRAVTGFNSSLDATKLAVQRLDDHGVPVLASRLSGDDIANQEPGHGSSQRDFDSLARIIPTNSATADALTDFHRKKALPNNETIVVSDERKDPYIASLEAAFTDLGEKGGHGHETLFFRSLSNLETEGTGNDFRDIAETLCAAKEIKTVYFAGRAKHLKVFATTLAQVNYCKQPYTIISGTDAASLPLHMSPKDWENLRGPDGRAMVKVQYAAPGHPEAWPEIKKSEKDLPRHLAEPAEALRTLMVRISEKKAVLKPNPELADSRTMLVYDGFLTIGEALHSLYDSRHPELLPDPSDISSKWKQFRLGKRVRATSGQICLTPGGNPYNKPVSVVELVPGEEGPGRPKFIGLAWPMGEPKPPHDDCPVWDDGS